MRRFALTAVSTLMLAASLAAAKASYPPYVQKELYADDVRGKPAPSFYVEKWLTDEPDRNAKVVIIDFWATWCPPCRKAIRELNQFQKQFQDDVVVIGVSKEPVDTLKKFMSKTKIDYAIAADATDKMANAIHVRGIPHVLIISTDGIVRWQGFPLSRQEPLTADIVKQIIAADSGVAARHAAATAPSTQPEQ